MRFIFLLPIALFYSIQTLGFTPSSDQKCAGFPRVTGYNLSLKNKCVGLALTKQDVPWGKPRRILFKDENTILVSDMGAWGEANRDIGALWEVNIKTKKYKKLFNGGNWTHGLAIDSKKRVLLGDSDKVLRINLDGKIETIINNLPTSGTHPLSHFILLPNDDLVLNIGASSNDCKNELKNGFSCKQRDLTGHLRLYKIQNDSTYTAQIYSFPNNFDKEKNKIIPTSFFARGLRNSMALLYNPVLNEIYQVENNIDTEGTYEELNIIPFSQELMHDYGWPFCKEMGVQTRAARNRFSSFCSKTAKLPAFLIPPHSAPLDMMYYNGKEHPELRGSIIMSWHGRRRAIEEALVSYKTDENGAPLVNTINQGFQGLISGISPTQAQPKLRPVGINSDSEGRIWIVDDVSNAILIYASSLEKEIPVVDEDELKRRTDIKNYMNNLSKVTLDSFEKVYTEFYSVQNCTSCHNSSEIPKEPKLALNNFLTEKWLNLNESTFKNLLLKRLHKDSDKPMPPFPDRPFQVEHSEEYEGLKNWAEENLQLN